MSKLHLTDTHSIIKNGQTMILNQPVYNITDEQLMKDNGFFKCFKCKDYFDVILEHSKYHPKFNEREYCSHCIQ